MIQETEGLIRLRQAYQDCKPDQFGLFLGAGINLPCGNVRSLFSTYTWTELLQELYALNRNHQTQSFNALRQKHGNDWLRFAEDIVGNLPTAQWVAQLDEIFYGGIPRSDKNYKRLSQEFLGQAPTLQAALCFSAEIRERKSNSCTFRRNSKVGIVMTTNYDFFFGAGWTRYQSFDSHWKVHTPTSDPPRKHQRPIVYLHGYLPYQKRKKQALVLRHTEYENAYRPEGFAAQQLHQAVSRYMLLFVGVSFADPPLRQALTGTWHRGAPRHFAIVPRNLAADVETLGVCAVPIDDYAEVAEVLKDVYVRALKPKENKKHAFQDRAQYWEQLALGPKRLGD
ncbi:MAG: SIR2 family protein [Chloroflexi bacterium]|nr:SIR2 family protein [Chloroflexota bacterium]